MQSGETTLDLVLHGVRLAQAGEISLQEFTEGVAYLSLIEQGVELPTVEQVEQRVAELNTSDSFISAIPRPED